MLYRIITEDCGNTIAVLDKVKKHFQCFTIYNARGFWDEKLELSLIIELDDCGAPEVGDYGFKYRVDSVAYAIKNLNNQDSVLVQAIPCNSKLI